MIWSGCVDRQGSQSEIDQADQKPGTATDTANKVINNIANPSSGYRLTDGIRWHYLCNRDFRDNRS